MGMPTDRKPIFGTDLSKPPSEIVESIRSAMAHIRGQMNDLGAAYPVWARRLDDAQGLMTCGLVALHSTKEEMREWEIKFGPFPEKNAA